MSCIFFAGSRHHRYINSICRKDGTESSAITFNILMAHKNIREKILFHYADAIKKSRFQLHIIEFVILLIFYLPICFQVRPQITSHLILGIKAICSI